MLRADDGFGKGIQRDVAGEELFEHRARGRRCRCPRRPSSSNCTVTSSPRAKAIGPAVSTRRVIGCAFAERRPSICCCICASVAVGVELEHLASAVAPSPSGGIEEREVVERKVADHAPGRVAVGMGRARQGRAAEHRMDCTGALISIEKSVSPTPIAMLIGRWRLVQSAVTPSCCERRADTARIAHRPARDKLRCPCRRTPRRNSAPSPPAPAACGDGVKSAGLASGILRPVEGLEHLFRRSWPPAKAGDALDLENFEVPRFGPIGNDVEFRLPLGKQNVVGAFWEKVDRRRAEKFEGDASTRFSSRVSGSFSAMIRSIWCCRLLPRPWPNRRTRRTENAAATRSIRGAAGSLRSRAARAAALRLRGTRRGGAMARGSRNAAFALACSVSATTTRAVREKSVRRDSPALRPRRAGRSSRSSAIVLNGRPVGRAEAQANRRPRAESGRQVELADIAGVVLRLDEAGSARARLPARCGNRRRCDRSARGCCCSEVPRGRTNAFSSWTTFVRREAHDRHRRHRRKVLRINRFEQRLGEAGKLGVELELNARGQEREAFEQPLDKWIGADFLGLAIQGAAGRRSWEIRGQIPRPSRADDAARCCSDREAGDP